MADYYRYYRYENRKLSKPTTDNNHMNGYGVTAFFFNWVDQNKPKIAGQSMLYWINKDARDGNYKDTLWTRFYGQTVEQVW
ncbi:unnamed protein product, partial [Allacma fusca]